MARILVTGMSATGKSSALAELARRGHPTVDTDEAPWTIGDPLAGGRTWDEPRMTALLAAAPDLYVSGCVSNQGRFYDRFPSRAPSASLRDLRPLTHAPQAWLRAYEEDAGGVGVHLLASSGDHEGLVLL